MFDAGFVVSGSWHSGSERKEIRVLEHKPEAHRLANQIRQVIARFPTDNRVQFVPEQRRDVGQRPALDWFPQLVLQLNLKAARCGSRVIQNQIPAAERHRSRRELAARRGSGSRLSTNHPQTSLPVTRWRPGFFLTPRPMATSGWNQSPAGLRPPCFEGVSARTFSNHGNSARI